MIFNLGPLGLRLGRTPKPSVTKATLGDLQTANVLPALLGIGTDTWAPTQYGNYYATSSPVYRAVKLRADTLALARLRIFRRGDDDTVSPLADNDPLQQLFDRVNDWWTASDLWKATETYLCMWGSAYWYLEWEGSTIKALWPLRPDRVRIIPDVSKRLNNYIAGFIYQGHTVVPLETKEVVWFRYFNPLDEYAGLSPIAAARAALDMGTNAIRFNGAFFKNGAVPADLIFNVQGPITEDEVNDFYRRLEKRHKGSDKAHRPMIWDLSQGAKPERLGLTQRDMEFMAALDFTTEEASRIYGVPPPKSYSQRSSIYNNVSQADREFYMDTMMSEWKFLEGRVNEMLLPVLGADERVFCAFDTSEVPGLQEVLALQTERQLKEIEAGVLLINEYREKHHRPPVPWGDVWWKPFSLDNPGDSGATIAGALAGGSVSGKAQDKFVTKALSTWEKRLKDSEQRFLLLQKRLFANQRSDILAKLREHKGSKQVDDRIFNKEAWDIAFKAKGQPLIAEILRIAAQGQMSDFGLGTFDPNRQAVLEWIKQRTEFWADRVNLETAQLLRDELSEAHVLGESIPQIQDRIEKVMKFNDLVRSERIARTETLAAANKGHLAGYEQSGVVDEKQWLAAMDERTRPAHAEAHRQVVPLGSNFLVGGESLEAPGLGGSPENVINCILPGQIVMASGILAASRAKYTGPALELATESGHKLSVTPNHPILSRYGWQAAQALRPGDDIVNYIGQERMPTIDEHVTFMPPVIEDIFASLDVIAGARRMSRGASIADFHSDGRFVDGNVDVVMSTRLLRCTCDTISSEPSQNKCLCGSDILKATLSALSTSNQFSLSPLSTSESVMCGLRQPASIRSRSSAHAGEHAFTSISRLNSVFQQMATEDVSRDAQRSSEGFLGLTRAVAFDKIVNVRQFNFSGHVFDLQTISGLYISNGIVVHNCRCTVVPIVRRKALSLNGVKE